jgi:surface polysaccharide O-acyltransferase-like enzyme
MAAQIKPVYPYLNGLRTLAIIGVIVLHTFPLFLPNSELNFSGFVMRNLFSFTVPMFVMVSGALLLSQPINNPKQFMLHRVKRVGIPLLTWFVLHGLTRLAADPQYSLSLYALRFFIFAQPYYLIWALLGLYLFTPFLQRLLQVLNRKEQHLLIISVFVISSVSSLLAQWLLAGNNLLPLFTVNYFSLYLGYYLAGYYAHQINHLSLKPVYLAITLFLIMALSYPILIRFGSHPKGMILFDGLSPLVILYTLMTFMVIKNSRFFQSNRAFVNTIAASAFGIYFIHMPILDVINQILIPFSWPPLALSLTQFSLSFMLSLALVNMVGRISIIARLLGFR